MLAESVDWPGESVRAAPACRRSGSPGRTRTCCSRRRRRSSGPRRRGVRTRPGAALPPFRVERGGARGAVRPAAGVCRGSTRPRRVRRRRFAGAGAGSCRIARWRWPGARRAGAQLRALERGELVEGWSGLPAEATVGFVFPGQGGQWPGMAVELMDSSPVFAEHMRRCALALAPHVDFDLEGVLRGEEGSRRWSRSRSSSRCCSR